MVCVAISVEAVIFHRYDIQLYIQDGRIKFMHLSI